MCRHLAYLGPAVPLARWLYDAPHALVRQSYAPQDMRGGGTINADGFGVGWYRRVGAEPVRYRHDQPMWGDPQLPELAQTISAPAMLAAVRSATPGMPMGQVLCAPFAGDNALFSLNGRIAGWPESMAALAARLPVVDLLTMPPSDSLLVWALLRQRLRAGEPADVAVAAVVCEILAAAPDSRLNLLLTDAQTIVATTVTHSLWAHHGEDAVLVSSEPLDGDTGWSEIPDRQLVVADHGGVRVTSLSDFPAP